MKKKKYEKSFLLKGKLALLSVHHITVIGKSKYCNIHSCHDHRMCLDNGNDNTAFTLL